MSPVSERFLTCCKGKSPRQRSEASNDDDDDDDEEYSSSWKRRRGDVDEYVASPMPPKDMPEPVRVLTCDRVTETQYALQLSDGHAMMYYAAVEVNTPLRELELMHAFLNIRHDRLDEQLQLANEILSGSDLSNEHHTAFYD